MRPETRAGRALAQWQRCNRSDRVLEAAVCEQLEEALYWERLWFSKRVAREIAEVEKSAKKRSSSTAAIRALEALQQDLIHKQSLDNTRDREMPDWNSRQGWAVAIPRLNPMHRPWPPALPLDKAVRGAVEAVERFSEDVDGVHGSAESPLEDLAPKTRGARCGLCRTTDHGEEGDRFGMYLCDECTRRVRVRLAASGEARVVDDLGRSLNELDASVARTFQAEQQVHARRLEQEKAGEAVVRVLKRLLKGE